MLHIPTLTEDAKHLSLIVTSAIAAVAATAGVFATSPPAPVEAPEPIRVIEVEWEPVPLVDPSAGADRLYGSVQTWSGDLVTGYLRWDSREASWADVLPAVELDGSAVAGLRFGHIVRVDVVEGNALRIGLKSGETTDVYALPSDGDGLLAPLDVERLDGASERVEWASVRTIEFEAEPLERAPSRDRLHGTVTTRSGLAFTGYVTWDLEEAFTDEALEGYGAAPLFDEISLVQRTGSGVHVVMADGVERDLAGTRDVDASNRGIIVADPALGSVTIPFERFRELRIHAPETPVAYESFDGGRELAGVVTTDAGERLSGTIVWDRDEARSWELIDGKHNGIDFHIELSKIARIQKTWMGSTVDLLDGRSFYLLASNDVNWTNHGIQVHGGSRVDVLPWDEFRSVEFTQRVEYGEKPGG